MNVMFLPLWVPTSLLKFVGSAPALLEADIEAVKREVLGIDTFYVTGVDKSPFAALYRGNMRGKSSEEVRLVSSFWLWFLSSYCIVIVVDFMRPKLLPLLFLRLLLMADCLCCSQRGFHAPALTSNNLFFSLSVSRWQVFEAVTTKLESIPGLGDRVQLFLMGDPTPLTPEQARQAICWCCCYRSLYCCCGCNEIASNR